MTVKEEKVAEIRQRFPFIDDKCKFNFGGGWAKIVMGFCGTVRFLAVDGFRITQLESRDGKLNIDYASTHNNSAVDRLVGLTEARSTHACEHCGYEFRASYTLGTRMRRVRNRQVRLCPGCMDRYEVLLLQGKEMAFKL